MLLAAAIMWQVDRGAYGTDRALPIGWLVVAEKWPKMWSAAAFRRIAVLAFVLAASGCEPRVTTPPEASRAVRDSFAWMADAELCPADLMREHMRVNGLKEMSCADAALPMCFSGCRKGDVDSCFWLANTLEHADSGDPAVQALYQRACTLGEPSGCTNRAAGMYLGKRRDPAIMKCAARTFERTCALHDAWGCSMFGNALHEGTGVPKDDARALEALAGACLNVDATVPACGAAQRLRDAIHEKGPGGP